MQGLDTAVKHFRETGVVRYLLHRYAGGTQQFRGTAGGQNIDTQRDQGMGEFDDTGFIRNTD